MKRLHSMLVALPLVFGAGIAFGQSSRPDDVRIGDVVTLAPDNDLARNGSPTAIRVDASARASRRRRRGAALASIIGGGFTTFVGLFVLGTGASYAIQGQCSTGYVFGGSTGSISCPDPIPYGVGGAVAVALGSAGLLVGAILLRTYRRSPSTRATFAPGITATPGGAVVALTVQF